MDPLSALVITMHVEATDLVDRAAHAKNEDQRTALLEIADQHHTDAIVLAAVGGFCSYKPFTLDPCDHSNQCMGPDTVMVPIEEDYRARRLRATCPLTFTHDCEDEGGRVGLYLDFCGIVFATDCFPVVDYCDSPLFDQRVCTSGSPDMISCLDVWCVPCEDDDPGVPYAAEVD